jgi:hypothetical protein
MSLPDICIVHDIISQCDKSMLVFDCFDMFFESVAAYDYNDEKHGWRQISKGFWTSQVKKRKSTDSTEDFGDKVSDDGKVGDAVGLRQKRSSSNPDEDFYTGVKCKIMLNLLGFNSLLHLYITIISYEYLKSA